MAYKFLSNNVNNTPLIRILTDDYLEKDYNKNDKLFYMPHWGQRKLLFSEIEFLTNVSKHICLKECLIVYIGAANGIHLNIFPKLFKDIKFLLYDPKPFKINNETNFIIKTGVEGFFTDEKINEVIEIADGKKIIFISDIRNEPSNNCKNVQESWEHIIWDDMLKQQKWAIKMNAEFMLLKFRTPYGDSKNNEKNGYKTDIDDIKDMIIFKDENLIQSNNEWNQILYLSGDLYLQLYAPCRSTETRLFVSKAKYTDEIFSENDGEKYLMKLYDSLKYEKQMNYYNSVNRNLLYVFDKSKCVKKHIIGYDDSYDSVSEYIILKNFFCFYENIIPTSVNIIKTLNQINLFLNDKTKKTLLFCTLDVYLKNMQKNKVDINDVNKLIKMICKMYKKQKEKIMQSKIFSSKEQQIQLLSNVNKKICFNNFILMCIDSNYECISNYMK